MSCATRVTVDDYTPVKNGTMALVRGYDIEHLKQLLNPYQGGQGIIIKGLNGERFSRDHIELLVKPGVNKFLVECSYQVQGGFVESKENIVSYDLVAGYGYYLKANYQEIRECKPSVERVRFYQK
jgi:hypothetical protein